MGVIGRLPNSKPSEITKLQFARLLAMKVENPNKFTKHTKLHPSDWDDLLVTIAPKLKSRNYYNSLAIEVKIAVTLRYLGGGLVTDISFCWGVPESSIYQHIREVLTAIDETVDNITFPFDNEEWLEASATENSENCSSCRRCCFSNAEACKVRSRWLCKRHFRTQRIFCI